MSFSPELLLPAGTLDKMRAAYDFGADAVYAGQPRYSLRARNNEFKLEQLASGIAEAHARGKKFYVASNLLPHNAKVKTYLADMAPVIAMQPDALIMADPGLIDLVREAWPEQTIHLSVQANTVNYAAVRFWKKLGVRRIILSRELSLDEVAEIRQECPDISLITCHDETLCVSWFPGMDGALIGFAGCVPEIICPAREVFANPDKHTLKEAQDWSDRIYHISQAIYGGGQPSGEAHARLKEALKQRGIFKSALMRKPVLPLNDEEKAWVALGLERSQLPEVDMTQFEDK